jgi:enoyl-CoA hydratase/carnithine racemase
MDVARKQDLPGNLPASLHAELLGDVAVLRLSRPQKRNALDDDTVAGIEIFFRELPSSVKAVVLHGEGDHFSAGLDLNELTERDFAEAVEHSRGWHRIFEQIEFGKVPVVSVLHGAVVGGGLELACSTHVRVAEESAYYGLPEGTRGIFVGGGGSVRIPRVIGVSRMMEMMLTGRTYRAEEGQALGLSHHLVPKGEGLK